MITPYMGFLRVTEDGGIYGGVAHESATIGEGVSIAKGAIVHPNVEIGDHCRILPGAIIDEGARLGTCVIVGADAVVGRFADVEPMAVIQRGQIVGAYRAVLAEPVSPMRGWRDPDTIDRKNGWGADA